MVEVDWGSACGADIEPLLAEVGSVLLHGLDGPAELRRLATALGRPIPPGVSIPSALQRSDDIYEVKVQDPSGGGLRDPLARGSLSRACEGAQSGGAGRSLSDAVGGPRETAQVAGGWASAVVESAEERGGREACLLKVPHHGSPNADDDALWEHLLETPATACVTSFGSTLPGEADLIRLQQRGGSKPHLVTTREQPAEIAALCIGVDPGVTTRSPGDAAFVRFVPDGSGWRAEHGTISEPVRTSTP